MVQYAKIIFYKEVVLLAFFLVIFFILLVLLCSYFRIQNLKKCRRTFQLRRKHKDYKEKNKPIYRRYLKVRKYKKYLRHLTYENAYKYFSYVVLTSFVIIIWLINFKIIKGNLYLTIYFSINSILLILLLSYSFKNEINKIVKQKTFTFFIRTLAFLIFLSISIFSNTLANLDILRLTSESSTLFPIALYLTTSILTLFFLIHFCIFVLTPIAILIMVLLINNMTTDFFIKSLLSFILFFSFYKTAHSLVLYFEDNGVEKILRYTSYIAVNERCGFNNEKNIWLSYLGGGNISVLTLDEDGNYHFKSRPCEPKGSSSESKK